jgi:ArsR family transcriptional regulator, cadmium/lead-responsive transcriptional repressor
MSRPDRPDPVFEALADPTRREVMRRLGKDGPSSATALAASLPVSRQAVSKHLSALEDAGLVEAERRGRQRLFRLTPAPLADAVGWMAEVGGRWDERLLALRRLLEL